QLLDRNYTVAGCDLVPNEVATHRVPRYLSVGPSETDSRGPYAWNNHWLLVPLHDATANVIGMIWVDDPVDRLLPTKARLEALRTFANQAATAIEAHERDAKLRLSEDQFRSVFEESPLGMVLVDRRLRVLDAN